MGAKVHVKKGDVVVAISGEYAGTGKSGRILQLFPRKGTAIVEGMNYVKKHMRKSEDNPQGGIIEKEAPIALSNLRLQKASDERAAKKPSARKKTAAKSSGEKKETSS